MAALLGLLFGLAVLLVLLRAVALRRGRRRAGSGDRGAVRRLRFVRPAGARPAALSQRTVELREVWPEAADNLASAVRGRSC